MQAAHRQHNYCTVYSLCVEQHAVDLEYDAACNSDNTFKGAESSSNTDLHATE